MPACPYTPNQVAAALAYDEKARQKHGPHALLNLPWGYPDEGKEGEGAPELGRPQGKQGDETDGDETDGEESFYALLALFQGRHHEKAASRQPTFSKKRREPRQ